MTSLLEAAQENWNTLESIIQFVNKDDACNERVCEYMMQNDNQYCEHNCCANIDMFDCYLHLGYLYKGGDKT